MRRFRGVFIAALTFILVQARPENSYSFDSLDSFDSFDSFDSIESNWSDPAPDDLFSDLPEVDDYSSDYIADLPNQDLITPSWDWASLPSCDSQSSLTDDFLQARDAASCPPKEPEGNPKLPTDLFQDPLQFLDNNLKTPPTGQDNQPNLHNQNDDLNFNAFMGTRPASMLDYPEDESICPPIIYGLSNTPVCHHPDRRSSLSDGSHSVLTLYDVTPCRCLISSFPCLVHLSAIADAPE